MGAHPCRGPISAQSPSIPRVPGGPTMHWPRSYQGSSIPSVHWGLSMLMAHPCSEAICAEGLLGPSNPKGLWGWRLIHAEGPFLPKGHLSQEPMGVYPSCEGPISAAVGPIHCGGSWGSIHAQSPPMPRVAKGPSLPGVYPSGWPMGAHLLPGPIPAQDSSIPRTHGGLSIPRAHPYQDPYLPRAHGGPSMSKVHQCRGSIP